MTGKQWNATRRGNKRQKKVERENWIAEIKHYIRACAVIAIAKCSRTMGTSSTPFVPTLCAKLIINANLIFHFVDPLGRTSMSFAFHPRAHARKRQKSNSRQHLNICDRNSRRHSPPSRNFSINQNMNKHRFVWRDARLDTRKPYKFPMCVHRRIHAWMWRAWASARARDFNRQRHQLTIASNHICRTNTSHEVK